MLYWRSNTGKTASIDFTNDALGGISYKGGAVSNEYINGVLDRTSYICLVTFEGSFNVNRVPLLILVVGGPFCLLGIGQFKSSATDSNYK